MPRTSPSPARFELVGSLKTGMSEASDVAALPGGRFIVVGDEQDSAMIVGLDGSKRRLDLPGLQSGQSQLEGVAFDPVRDHLFVAREEARELLRYEWSPASKSAVLEKTIELDGGGPSNKGIEGLAYLPVEHSPTGQPQLILAKEGKPRELSIIGDGGKGKPVPIALGKDVLAALRDFSAVTVDPRTGHLFLGSDESAAVAELALVRDGDALEATLVQTFPLRDAKGESLARVEGLAFDEAGDLFVLTENDGKLHRLARK